MKHGSHEREENGGKKNKHEKTRKDRREREKKMMGRRNIDCQEGTI